MTAERPAGGLAEEVDEKVLHAAFIPFGDITDIQIPLDYETGVCPGGCSIPGGAAASPGCGFWGHRLGAGVPRVSLLPLSPRFPPSRKAPGIRLRGV